METPVSKMGALPSGWQNNMKNMFRVPRSYNGLQFTFKLCFVSSSLAIQIYAFLFRRQNSIFQIIGTVSGDFRFDISFAFLQLQKIHYENREVFGQAAENYNGNNLIVINS